MDEKTPHQWLLVVLPKAKDVFDKFSQTNKQGMFRRLEQLLVADNPYLLPFLDMLQEPKYERARRFRVGDFRVLIIVETEEVEHQTHTYRGTLFVIKIGDRKDVY